MRTIAAIAASAALAVTLLASTLVSACEGKTCRADFECDPHQICMQWPNGSATCEWPGANPVVRVLRGSDAKSCGNDLDCLDGWRCEKQAARDDLTTTSAVCIPAPTQRITY